MVPSYIIDFKKVMYKKYKMVLKDFFTSFVIQKSDDLINLTLCTVYKTNENSNISIKNEAMRLILNIL